MKMLGNSLWLLVILVGCVPPSVKNQTRPEVRTDVTRLAKITYPSKEIECDIQLLTQMPSDRKYEELAILAAVTDTGTYTSKDLESMLPSLRAKACALGADAIVIRNVDPGGSPMWNEFNSRTPGKAFCVAIRFIK